MSQLDLIDLSHTVEDGLITYKGLPAPVICDYLSREASRQVYNGQAEFHIGKIEMVANTGTYILGDADQRDLCAQSRHLWQPAGDVSTAGGAQCWEQAR